MNTAITFEKVLDIGKIINENGIQHCSKPDSLKSVKIFASLFNAQGEFIYSNIKNSDAYGLEYKELISRYIYLQCVLDQGPEIQGIHQLLSNITNQLYEKQISFLHDPSLFFHNLNGIVDLMATIIPTLQEDGRRRTGIRGYSLLDQARICPTLTFRRGTPLLIISKLIQKGMGLLEWVKSWNYADQIVAKLKEDDLYGLGRAIGDKASRLFMKNVIYTFRLIESEDPKWNTNSYQIPIDSNIGRILMRSGIVFYFIPEQEFISTCCQEQKDGRVNLGSNRLRNIPFPQSTPEYRDALQLVQRWNSRLRSIYFPVSLNLIVEKMKEKGIKSGVGVLDDGMMYIGTNFCSNNIADMKCNQCPLGNICMANTQESELKTKYYCGTGEGIFY